MKKPVQVTLIMKTIKPVKLDKIYDRKVEGLRIRTKCDRYEKGEKSKRHAIQKQIKTFVVKDEVQKNKLKSIKTFSKSNDISRQKVLQHLKDKNLPKLNDYQCALCDAYITEEEVKHQLNKMEINKSPGNDSLTKGFY